MNTLTFSKIIHYSQIGKYINIATNAVIWGRIKISELCYIGSNSTILPEKKTGMISGIGAGAVVTKDVKESATVIGSSAKELMK